jgi:hypothetical protein
MERSERGIFSLNLRLYPGRYEVTVCFLLSVISIFMVSDLSKLCFQIKFIVDGVWKNDPLRPTLYNNGNENNLLVVT